MQNIIEKVLQFSQTNQQLLKHKNVLHFVVFVQLFYQDNNTTDFENYTEVNKYDNLVVEFVQYISLSVCHY